MYRPVAALSSPMSKARYSSRSSKLTQRTADPTMSTRPKRQRGIPEGLWIHCPKCKATIFRKEAESRLNVCPECAHHFYVSARDRIAQLLDAESFEEWFTDI